MTQKITFPFISENPAIMIRITSDEETISEFFVILLRELGVPPKVQIDISQSEGKKHTAYAVISVKSEEELKKKKEEITKILSGVENISWEVLEYKKIGKYYVARSFFEFSVETVNEPIVMMSLSRYVGAIEKMSREMGTIAHEIMLSLGIDSGTWIAKRYGESLKELVEKDRLHDVVDFIVSVLSLVRNIPKSFVKSEGDTIVVEFNDKMYMSIYSLIATNLYGVIYSLLRTMGYDTTLERSLKTSMVEKIRVHIGSKDISIEIRY